MPGALDHSPADVLRYLLIDKGMGTLPTDSLDWPIFVDNEPDRPDECITIYNTTGRKNGRTIEGEIQEHHGIQIRIRSAVSEEGYPKARILATTLDEEVYTENVYISGSVYCVHSFSRVDDIRSLGKDTPTPTKRSIYIFNGLLMVRMKESGTGTI